MQTSLMKRDEKQTATPGGIAVSEDMLQPVAVANNPNRQPFNGEALLTKVNDNWFKLAIFWQQFDFIALFFQALNGNFVINTCDNDLTVTYILSFMHCQQVTIHNADIFIDIPPTRSRKSAFGLNKEGST